MIIRLRNDDCLIYYYLPIKMGWALEVTNHLVRFNYNVSCENIINDHG